MKNIVLIGALLLFLVGVFLYTSDQTNQRSFFSSEMKMRGDNLTKLPEYSVEPVRPTEIVELKDGDSYDMEATIVTQEVGNRTIKRLAYNGQIPGPVLKVEKNAEVTVHFTNNIDMETALHSHGLRGDWRMDGAVPITPPVKVGETFSYVLEFPDTGVYWYHPHVREDYQQELGLYGNFIVEEDGYWNEADQEEYLIVDDILENGDFSREFVSNTLMGRFGDTLLINDEEDYRLTVNQGEIVRAFITNVANTRTFELEFEGADMKLVGGDLGRIEREEMIEHQVIAPAERYIVELLYSEPGTYAIDHRGESIGTVTVLPSDSSREMEFMTLRSNADDYADIRAHTASLLAQSPDKNLRLDIKMKGMMGNMMQNNSSNDENGTVTLMGVEMTREGAIEHCKGMPGMMGCEPFLEDDGHTHDHDLAENHGIRGMMGGLEEVEHSGDGIEWEDDMAMMNQMSTSESIEWIIEDTDTEMQNGDIEWSFSEGDMVKVRIFNDPGSMHPMQLPIHFHGQRFVVLARDGVGNENLQWKDTALIRSGETVDLLVDMSNPGNWMTHCHIAEHLEAGMMFTFNVE